MDINTIVKVANVTLAASALALTGIGIYCTKKQYELNRSIDEGMQKIARDQHDMKMAYLNVTNK